MLSRRTFLMVAGALTAGCGLGAETAGTLRIGGGDPGGMYLAFAELLAGQIHTRYADVDAQALATEGTVENLARLRSGDIDLGLALADVVERDSSVGNPDAAPVALARVYENYLQVVVRDSASVQQLSDLRGKRISIGAARSGGATTSEVLFEAAGLRGNTDLVNFRLRDALDHLAAGEIDALVWSGGVPTPAIVDLDAQLALRTLDIAKLTAPMIALSGYPYVARRVPACNHRRAANHHDRRQSRHAFV